jgi:perosamine synthetase
VTRLTVFAPLPPGTAFRRPSPPGHLLAQPGVHLFSRARHGLAVGLPALGLKAGDEVLVPAYHHGSEVETIIGAGLTPRYYGGRGDLRPDETELDALRSPRTRALHLIHYLGFPQDAEHWRRWCDERGFLLLEDAAQAWLATWLGRPVGLEGDLSISCIYKTQGVWDGATLRLRPEIAIQEPWAIARGVLRTAKRHVAWFGMRSGLAGRVFETGGTKAYDPAADFHVGQPLRPSRSTSYLLPRLPCGAAEHRRENYRRLLDRFGDAVPSPFDDLGEGASPFAFPVEVSAKKPALARLRVRGVEAVDFWSVPHPSLDVSGFPGVRGRRDRTILVPIHQGLRKGDLARIESALGALPELDRAS